MLTSVIMIVRIVRIMHTSAPIMVLIIVRIVRIMPTPAPLRMRIIVPIVADYDY